MIHSLFARCRHFGSLSFLRTLLRPVEVVRIRKLLVLRHDDVPNLLLYPLEVLTDEPVDILAKKCFTILSILVD